MKKIALLLSHKLTNDQVDGVWNVLKCKKTIKMTENLQKRFGMVEIGTREQLENELKNFLKNNLNAKDYVLIQGEYGITYSIVKFCKEHDFVPVYSVSKRVSSEIEKDGVIEKVSYFKHEGFIEY
ncbi:MAG: hypothetical protein KA384_08245 [Leptotrichiaceae bacterium]|nr:hypothetical protein [Leptotrichiaceae bacterium]